MKQVVISRITGEILAHREFSSPDFQLGTIHTVGIIQQLVKLMNIYQGTEADNNLKHWIIDTLQNVYLKNSIEYPDKKPQGGSQSMFVLNEDENSIQSNSTISKLFGDELLIKIKSKRLNCGDDFIVDGIKRAEGESGIKYKRYFTNLENNKDFIETVRRLVKFISLCLSSQLSPTENFYNNKIDRLKVNYSIKNNRSIQEIRAIIISCLISYFESNGIFDYSENLSLYMDPNFNG